MKCYYEEDGSLVVDKKLLQAILMWANSDRAKPPQNQLFIEPHRICATDGRAMLVVELKNGPVDAESYGVDADWLRAELKSSTMKLIALDKREDDVVCLERRDPDKPESVLVEIFGGVYPERFPPVDQVLPEYEPNREHGCATVMFDPALMVRFDKLVAAIDGCRGVRFQFDKPLDPIRFDVGSLALRCHGAVMPMRDTSLPEDAA